MKRLFAVLGVVLGMTALAVFVFSERFSENEETITGPSGADLYTAIHARMEPFETSQGANVDLLVPGEKVSDMTWNFRGGLKDQVSSKPFFGTIRSVCEDFSDAGCWELVTLSVDGMTVFSEDAVQPGSNPPTALAAQEIEAAPVSAPVTMETADAAARPQKPDQTEDASLRTASAEAGAPDIDASEAPPPARKIWHTQSDNVNGRMGPGTEYDVAFKIPPRLDLALVETKEDWGLFRYPARDGKEGKIWIWMPLVEQQ